MDQHINAYLEKERLLATIASLFSGIALLLAAVGLYGVMSYAVARRTNEIGLRMALGAQRRQVLDMILTDGAGVAVLGVAIGVPAASALSRVLSSVLFDVKADLGLWGLGRGEQVERLPQRGDLNLEGSRGCPLDGRDLDPLPRRRDPRGDQGW